MTRRSSALFRHAVDNRIIIGSEAWQIANAAVVKVRKVLVYSSTKGISLRGWPLAAQPS